MINVVWLGLIAIGMAFAVLEGRPEVITSALFDGAREALTAAVDLLAVVTAWLGISKVAERAGLLRLVARLLGPFLRRLFPGIPRDHPALGSISLNISANMLGLANAATPFGLKAMEHLQELNPEKDRASHEMITFLALNSAVLILVPASAIAFRAATGSEDPGAIALPAILATGCALFAALLANHLLNGTGRNGP